MNLKTGCLVVFIACLMTLGVFGCAEQDKPYGTERQIVSTLQGREVWAVAPAIDLSGMGGVDPLLQADLLYQQLQQVRGLTVIPVNRVAEAYARLNIDKVQSAEQATLVCEMLGCDRLIVPTVTIYDPYAPPKFGASLQLIARDAGAQAAANVDPRDLARRPAPTEEPATATRQPVGVVQSVGMFDAANGSVREALLAYAAGRNDPAGPMGPKEYLASMDRYCGFVYHELIVETIARAERATGRRRS